MKKHVLAAIISAIVLLAFAFLGLQIAIKLFPSLAEEYFSPVFRTGSENAVFYFLHPVFLSFALAWFWNQFKARFKGNFIVRGFELGLVYAFVAIIPMLILNLGALNISLGLVIAWFAYCITQAIIAGVIFAKVDP